MTKNLERKKKEQIQGRTNKRRLIFNPTIQHVIVNLYTKLKLLSFMVVEISFTKSLERKKKGQTQGRTNRRMPICNPTIQLVVKNLYTKYEVSILNGCGDIFDEKVGTTDRCKPVYPPPTLFQSGGIINIVFPKCKGPPTQTRPVRPCIAYIIAGITLLLDFVYLMQ